jgi:hypothetical protein
VTITEAEELEEAMEESLACAQTTMNNNNKAATSDSKDQIKREWVWG